MKYIKLLSAAAAVFYMFSISAECSQQKENLLLSVKNAEKHNNSKVYKMKKPFRVYDTGSEKWISYSKYGVFHNLGTENYSYVITDMEGLKKASGEGIYPNTQSILNSPLYNKVSNKLKGDRWKFVNTDEHHLNFYKWGTLKNEDPGIKLFYTARALEKSGNYSHAVKAYYACLVFFPRSVGYTPSFTPWYVAPVCVSKIKYLTEKYPEIGVKLTGEDIKIKNSFDIDKNNDIFIITPGQLKPASAEAFVKKYTDFRKTGIKKITGNGAVKLIQYNNEHFELTVDDKQYIIRATSYSPNKVGLTPSDGNFNNIKDWFSDDYNQNGLTDGPFDTWVDANRNEIRDKNEAPLGDFALMKEMGINTLRIYHYYPEIKKILKHGYEKYGFMYLMGDLAGMYGIESGADYKKGTDYTDADQKERMLASIKRMVEELKEEPYVLMWVLGNENNYSIVGKNLTGSQAKKHPEAYYKFINECAKLIKSLDPYQRPVAVCNGDTYLLDYCAKYAPDIDIYGANAYRGEEGFGSLWRDVRDEYGKAVLITEFGCSAYASSWDEARAEEAQASYHKGNWKDIENNFAGTEEGAGNALGGVIFEWNDEWWKAGGDSDPAQHDTLAQWTGPFPDGHAYEEWFGICGLGDGKGSPFKRQLRKAYFMYRDLWKKYK